MTKCLILSIEEWVEKKNKEKIVVEKINLKKQLDPDLQWVVTEVF